MSIESRKHQYGTVFDHWQIKNTLGEGSGGKSAVFQLVHTSSPGVKSALKVISLIEERGNIDALSAARRADYEAARKVCKDNAEQEVLLMNDLQGNTNIVDYLDHTFVDWSDDTGFGCDMLIRMELLTDLRSEIQSDKEFSEADVLKVGRDVCQALILCHKKNILHRDIKPENIFKNKDGNYKLGDFGVSRIMSAAPMSMASTSIGTPEYAAPEQFSGMHDLRIDIYSLGLVLYELCNGKKLPFANSSYITQQEVQMRQMGTPIPAPTQASEKLSQVILKACSFNAAERYQTAQELFDDLDAVTKGKPLVAANQKPSYATMPAQPVAPSSYATMPAGAVNQNMGQKPASKTTPVAGKTAPQQQNKTTPKKRSKGKLILLSILAGILAVAILVAVLFFNWYNSPEQKALRAMDAGNYDSVLSILDENPSVDENAKLIDAARNQITNIRNDFINGSMTYEDAKDALSDLSAMHLDEIVDELDEATEYIDSLHNSGEFYNAAEELFANGQYDKAIENYRLVNEADDNYENAQKKISEATDLYRNVVLTEAQEKAAVGNYTDAINTLSNALAILPEDTIIQGKIAEYENEFKANIKENALAEASQLAADKNYLGAIEVLNAALVTCENDADLIEKTNQYESLYEADVSTQVDKYLENNEISAARSLLQTATNALPNNAKISSMWTEIQLYKSISVRSLTPLNATGTWNESNIKLQNALGETFSDAANSFIPCQNSYGEYYIGGQYTMVTGNLTSYYWMKEERICSFQIWADNTIIYNSPVITQKTKQFSFSIVLPENTQNIKFVCAANGYNCSEILLTDLFLWNDPHYYENHPSNGSVAVRSLTPINATGTWNSIPLIMENALGDSLADTQSFFIPCQNSYGEYYIEGKFSRVTGNLTSYTYMGEGRECTLQILADDKVIYTSPTITQNTKQVPFDVKLPEGTQFVKFVCNANGYSCSEIFVTDLLLWE